MPQSALRGKAGHHMLENLDLDMWMDQAEWDAVSGELKKKLGVLQQRARALKIPTVIVFEGWARPAKATSFPGLSQIWTRAAFRCTASPRQAQMNADTHG